MIFLQDNTDVISLGHQLDTSNYFNLKGTC